MKRNVIKGVQGCSPKQRFRHNTLAQNKLTGDLGFKRRHYLRTPLGRPQLLIANQLAATSLFGRKLSQKQLTAIRPGL